MTVDTALKRTWWTLSVLRRGVIHLRKCPSDNRIVAQSNLIVVFVSFNGIWWHLKVVFANEQTKFLMYRTKRSSPCLSCLHKRGQNSMLFQNASCFFSYLLPMIPRLLVHFLYLVHNLVGFAYMSQTNRIRVHLDVKQDSVFRRTRVKMSWQNQPDYRRKPRVCLKWQVTVMHNPFSSTQVTLSLHTALVENDLVMFLGLHTLFLSLIISII